MNAPILAAAAITFAAFLAHLLVGTRETIELSPHGGDPRRTTIWIQAMAVFQMLSVDLLAVSALLLWIGLADLGDVERPMAIALACLFLLWAGSWLTQMIWLRASGVSVLKLPQWVAWLVCSGLLFWSI